MQIEALILRRCYPVPMTFADLRRAYDLAMQAGRDSIDAEYKATRKAMCEGKDPPAPSKIEDFWPSALKGATGALDEVYAVVDGREVRVAVVDIVSGTIILNGGSNIDGRVNDLLIAAERAGYWERPHEVRIDLPERPVSHDAVARAVLVAQLHLERGGKAVRS